MEKAKGSVKTSMAFIYSCKADSVSEIESTPTPSVNQQLNICGATINKNEDEPASLQLKTASVDSQDSTDPANKSPRL